MSWYDTVGCDEAHVLWSRVIYYRNLSGLPFSSSKDKKLISRICAEAEEVLLKNGFHKAEGDAVQMLSYAEKQYCCPGFSEAIGDGALFLNEPCNLSVSVGGKDMLCIQSLLSGRAVGEALRIASHAEELLDKSFDFAYSKKFGYLSSVVSRSGHGMSFSSALFLPALAENRMIVSERYALSHSGFEIYPFFTYKDNPGNIFLLSYTPSVGQCEEDAASAFDSAVERIISLEKEYERMISADNMKDITDKGLRVFGVMEYAPSVSVEELLSMLSSLRLFLLLDRESERYGIGFIDINALLCKCLPASIAAEASEPPKSKDDCDVLRAAVLHSFLSDRKKSV